MFHLAGLCFFPSGFLRFRQLRVYTYLRPDRDGPGAEPGHNEQVFTTLWFVGPNTPELWPLDNREEWFVVVRFRSLAGDSKIPSQGRRRNPSEGRALTNPRFWARTHAQRDANDDDATRNAE